MVWDEEWASRDPVPTGVGKGHGAAWELLNNTISLEWQRFNTRLEEHETKREADGKPIPQSSRAEHVSRFRAVLYERYGTSSVDPRWEAERARRLSQRETRQGYERGAP
jgi:hypothetical protein